MKKETIRRREELRKKNNKKSKDFFPMLLTGLMIFIVMALTYTYYLTTAVDKNSTEKITVEVKESYGSVAIGDLLYKQDVIKSPMLFNIYSRLNSNKFYSGKFEVSKNMNIFEVMSILTNTKNAKSGITLSVIEGENIDKISKKVESITNVKADEFKYKVNDATFIKKLKEEFPNLITDELDDDKIKYKLEGYLYPAGYSIDATNDSNAEAIIRAMVKATNDNVVPLFNKNKKVWNIGGVNKNISIHDYITLASILEKESTSSTDNASIAGVFLNRLAVNMPLQTDPSVVYGLELSNAEISFEHLRSKNSYNTYTNLGLTPGPIASPSQKSYEAINNFVDHDYLFFLTDKKGNAYFAKTYAEHEKLAREHVEGYIATGSGN